MVTSSKTDLEKKTTFVDILTFISIMIGLIYSQYSMQNIVNSAQTAFSGGLEGLKLIN